MQATRRSRREGAVVWLVVALLHAGFGWLLTRGMQVQPRSTGPAGTLQVVYFRRVARIAPRPRRSPGPDRRAPHPAGPLQPTPPQAATIPTPPSTPATPRAARPMSMAFLAQAQDWARRQAQAEASPPAPFSDPPPRLPGGAGERFRMRPPRSPAALVAAVGGYLLAPPGYEADPCPRNQRNIAALRTGEDPVALRQELEFGHRYCR